MEIMEIRKKRIRYRSWHRGCKETDILLGHYCDQHIDAMDAQTLDAFEAVLNEEDADLYQWLTRKQPVPYRLADNPILAALLEFEVHNLWPVPATQN
ncbi:succinate dehydrogenase assembly factor 2 [bacterium]|nr:succinate dehydrogenase assembly factor 2 [bacterium]